MESLESPQKQLSDEAQLLKEGRELVARAVKLSTQTHKIKVWVPILCSMILTGYYLYGLHKKNASSMDPGQPAAPSAVVEEAPAAQVPAGKVTPGQSAAGESGAGQATAGQAAATPVEETPSPSSDASDSYSDLRKQAQQAHAAKQFEDEGKLWQQFMEKSPLPQEACPAIGKAYERAGQIDLSIQAYERCVSLEPANADLFVGFAHVLETKRDFHRAATLYRQVLAKDPKNLDAQTGIALLALKQDRLQEAEAQAEAILRKAPNQTDALLVAGIVAWRQARLPDAERIFSRGAALDDQRPDFHAFLGRIAEAERRPRQALEQYDKALALDPGDSEIFERRDRLQQAH